MIASGVLASSRLLSLSLEALLHLLYVTDNLLFKLERTGRFENFDCLDRAIVGAVAFKETLHVNLATLTFVVVPHVLAQLLSSVLLFNELVFVPLAGADTATSLALCLDVIFHLLKSPSSDRLAANTSVPHDQVFKFFIYVRLISVQKWLVRRILELDGTQATILVLGLPLCLPLLNA